MDMNLSKFWEVVEDGKACWAMVRGVAKSQTGLSNWTELRLPCPSLSPWVCSNSCPLSYWCHPTISPSATAFFFCFQSFPASVSFPMIQLFKLCNQSIGDLASVLPMNIQDWSPIGLTGLISSQSKGLSRVFSSTTIWKHQFFSTQPSFWSNSDIHTWLLENP